MLRLPISLTLAVLTLATAQTTAQRPTTASGSGQKFWPTWRGPLNTGTSPTAQPPTEWSETKNVRWKVELPGRGSASPIVWGNHVYVLTAVPADRAAGARGVHRFLVMALNRKDGKVVWQQTAKEEAPHEGTHQEFGTMASPSASDRWRAHHRVVRVARHLRLRHERQAGLAERPRRQAHAQRVRRRIDARALQGQAVRRLGSPGRIVHRRAQQADG